MRAWQADENPQVSVVIPTRNRGAGVASAVRSMLASSDSWLELIVVDQSTNDLTGRALRPWNGDPRLTVLKTDSQGISAARNTGVEAARADIIGFTDDDCEAPPAWARHLRAALEAEPDLSLLFGNVVAGPHDAAAGFVPASVCRESTRVRRAAHTHRIGGMGACMGVRRSLWRQLGGFDERLGAGTRFGAGEETDFLLRALLAGHPAARTPELELVHHGFRTWEQGRELIRRYWFGTGAAFGIHFTSSPWSVASVLGGLGRGFVRGRSTVAHSLGENPHRRLRLRSFLEGFLAGLPLKPRRSRP